MENPVETALMSIRLVLDDAPASLHEIAVDAKQALDKIDQLITRELSFHPNAAHELLAAKCRCYTKLVALVQTRVQLLTEHEHRMIAPDEALWLQGIMALAESVPFVLAFSASTKN